jgi:hypothetical protein
LSRLEKAQFLGCAEKSKNCAERFSKGSSDLGSENFGAVFSCADSAQLSAHPQKWGNERERCAEDFEKAAPN